MSSSLKSLTQQLDGYDLSADHHEIVYGLLCKAYELGKKSKVEEGFYKFPVPPKNKDFDGFDDFDERYLLLEGKTLRLVHEKYGYVETTMTFNKNENGLKYSNVLAWVSEDDDNIVWEAAEASTEDDSGWTAYVNIDLTRYVKRCKMLASTLGTGTLFLGRINGVTRNLLTTSKYTSSMICVPIGSSVGYSPEDVEVVEVLASNISEEGIWL